MNRPQICEIIIDSLWIIVKMTSRVEVFDFLDINWSFVHLLNT